MKMMIMRWVISEDLHGLTEKIIAAYNEPLS